MKTTKNQNYINKTLNKDSIALACVAAFGLFVSAIVSADEGAASVWLPGQFGSLAAAPSEPGWSLPTVYYHTSADAGSNVNFAIGGQIAGGLDVRADILLLVPTYTFATPVLGAQAQVSMTLVAGNMNVSAEATITGPGGAVLSRNVSDSVTGFGDLFSMGSLRWNDGNNNWLAYTQVGAPLGSYQMGRLANLGLNHWSTDVGGGYTYFNPKSGYEFSVVAGVTYNFENNDTNYQSGVDGHIDWGFSKFVSEQMHVGMVGYFYNQLSGDNGSGAKLGDFKSRTNGIGPQLGYAFPMNGGKAYFNLKGFYEFNNKNRPAGWNTWVTLVIPISSTSAK